jgi:hypothetical protein
MRSNLTEIDLCHACGPLVTRYVLGTRRACFGRDVRERPADADPSGPLGRAGPCRPHPSPNACLLMATTAANPVHNGRWVLSPQYLPITPRAQRPLGTEPSVLANHTPCTTAVLAGGHAFTPPRPCSARARFPAGGPAGDGGDHRARRRHRRELAVSFLELGHINDALMMRSARH